MPQKALKLTSLDDIFSLAVRIKAEWRCVRCRRVFENPERGTPNFRGLLQCSHYWNRGRSGTRFSFENCDALCYACHYGNAQGWEYDKQGAYRIFMLKKLGQEGYDALEKLAHSTVQLRQKELREIKNQLQTEIKKHG